MKCAVNHIVAICALRAELLLEAMTAVQTCLIGQCAIHALNVALSN